MSNFIPLSVPHLTGNATKYLSECIETGYVSTVGPFVDRFEEALASYCGVRYAVATTSGTSALHLALICCGLEKDQEVLAPTCSFVASVNPIRYCSAWPLLVDVDAGNWTIDVERVRRFLASCERSGGHLINPHSSRRVVGIVPVHLYGHSADLDGLLELCERYDLFLVEDNAESLGGSYKGQRLGARGTASALSFNGNKTITSGAGGAILTNDSALALRAKHLSTQAKKDPIAYVHDEIGYNYRMNNLSAALGLSQLEVLDSFLEKKARIAARYRSELKDLVDEGILNFQREASWAQSSHWLNAITLQTSKAGGDAAPWQGLVQHLETEKIQSRPFWHPLHQLEPHRDLQVLGGETTVDLCRRGVCLPSSVALEEGDQDRVIRAVREFFTTVAPST